MLLRLARALVCGEGDRHRPLRYSITSTSLLEGPETFLSCKPALEMTLFDLDLPIMRRSKGSSPTTRGNYEWPMSNRENAISPLGAWSDSALLRHLSRWWRRRESREEGGKEKPAAWATGEPLSRKCLERLGFPRKPRKAENGVLRSRGAAGATRTSRRGTSVRRELRQNPARSTTRWRISDDAWTPIGPSARHRGQQRGLRSGTKQLADATPRIGAHRVPRRHGAIVFALNPGA